MIEINISKQKAVEKEVIHIQEMGYTFNVYCEEYRDIDDVPESDTIVAHANDQRVSGEEYVDLEVKIDYV